MIAEDASAGSETTRASGSAPAPTNERASLPKGETTRVAQSADLRAMEPQVEAKISADVMTPTPEIEAESKPEVAERATPAKKTRRTDYRLPGALASRFDAIAVLGGGGEADIVHVRPKAGGEEQVAKVYRLGIEPKPAILEQLRDLYGIAAVELFEYGESDGHWYELLEYAPYGSLADLLKTKRGSEDLALEVVAQLSRALTTLHGLAPCIVHRDLKPSNILVRSLQPLVLVVADFGIATNIESTMKYTMAHRSIHYTPPEGMYELVARADEKALASVAFDWWSLGAVLLEVLTGRTPFEGASMAQIFTAFMSKAPVDLQSIWGNEALRSPRDWARLIRGLLQLDREDRWGGQHVQGWLEGDSPPLPPESEAWIRVGAFISRKETRSAEPLQAAKAYMLEDRRCFTLKELGEAMALYWDEATDRISRPALLTWLEESLGDHNAAIKLIRVVEAADLSPEQRVTAFLGYVFPSSEARDATDDQVRKVCVRAEAGVPEAQLSMAALLIDGTFPRNLDKAETLAREAAAAGLKAAVPTLTSIEGYKSLFKKAAEGDSTAQFQLFEHLQAGDIAPDYDGEAIGWTAAAAESGHVGAQVALGLHFWSPPEPDYPTALLWMRKAADQGHPAAEYYVGYANDAGLGGYAKDPMLATEWYRKAAARGYAQAQFCMGSQYQYGVGVEDADPKEAIKWFRLAADQGHPRAAYHIGLLYAAAEGMDLDREAASKEAAVWYLRAANQNISEAMAALGECYCSGRGVEQDYEAAASWFLQAAGQGVVKAKVELGRLYLSGLAEVSGEVAIPFLQEAADAGDGDACLLLGEAGVQGDKTELDWDKAYRLFSEAVRQGVAGSRPALGKYCLMIGHCQLDKDDGLAAAHWYQAAADNGDLEGRFHLGALYETGRSGIEKDLAKALGLYESAAEGGDATALWRLGVLYSEGAEVTRDGQKALAYFEAAAGHGHAGSQFRAGRMYYQGLDVNVDHFKGLNLLQAAVSQGDIEARDYLADQYVETARDHSRKKNREQALNFYKKAAELENAVAEYVMGNECHRRTGASDLTEAAIWWRKAADKGHSVAQRQLGLAYEQGRGVEKNFNEAAILYRKAAAQNDTVAQYRYGRCFEFGQGEWQNVETAYEWYIKAAQPKQSGRGYAAAQYAVGMFHLRGIAEPFLLYFGGGTISLARDWARHWFEKAAEQGHIEAKQELAKMNRSKAQ